MEQDVPAETDSGLAGLVVLLRVCGIAADPEQMRHDLGGTGAALSADDLLRAAQRAGAKARWVTRSISGAEAMPLPSLAALRDGQYLILAGVQGEQALVQEPGAVRPSLIPLDELQQRCTGRFLLIVPS